MTESFAELFEKSQTLNKLKPGAIVSGIVVEIRNDVVVVNAGLKSEGIVPIEQFRNEQGELEVAVGDEVKVALDAIEDGFGETRLSREKAKRSLVWDELEEAQQSNATVTGRISGKVKGGFIVDIKDVRAFLSTSKARNWNSRSSSSTASATTWSCRVARSSRASTQRNANSCSSACR